MLHSMHCFYKVWTYPFAKFFHPFSCSETRFPFQNIQFQDTYFNAIDDIRVVGEQKLEAY